MKYKLTVLLLLLTLFNNGFAIDNNRTASTLKDDETLVFFETSAWFNIETKQWHIPIHGWVFELEDSKIRKGIIEKTFKTLYKLETTAENQINFEQRVNYLLADNESNKSIVIRFANRTYALSASQPNGHFSSTLVVDAQIINQAMTENSQLLYQAVLAGDDPRVFTGEVNLLAPIGLSIISDIDDTIKISHVTERSELLKHTFYLDFKAAPGMADMYQKWLNPGGALHFVSSSPWQLYPALVTFIEESGFPQADYALKSFRFKDRSLFNLMAKSTETKPPQIIEILKKYPHRRFMLIGDSGEYDPEIYAQILQQYPKQIIKILIRNVTEESPTNTRFKTTFKDLDPNLWQLFKHPDEIKLDYNRITKMIKLTD